MENVRCVLICMAIFLLGITVATQNRTSNIPETEMHALQDLYTSTNGTYWSWKREVDGSRWNFTEPLENQFPCQDGWQGIDCVCGNKTCNVISIVLENYTMSGTLPPTLSNLTKLGLFDLKRNSIGGSLPRMTSFQQLFNLDLQGNNFTGLFPRWIYESTNLSYLSLANNALSGTIPSHVAQMVNIEQFFMEFNRFTGTIPSGLNAWTKVKSIALDANELTGTIPVEFGTLTTLRLLALFRNELSGTIPPSLGNLGHMFYLDLSHNNLIGHIPPVFASLSNLTFLVLTTNYLSGPVPSPALWTNMHDLSLSSNQFTGSLPAVSSRALGYYDMSGNSFTGSIPAVLFQHEELNYFDISYNLITGTLPSQFVEKNVVDFIATYNNYLTGTIPTTLSQLTYLVDLLLYSNLLSGTLPFGMCDLHILESVLLQDNLLTGTLDNLVNASAPTVFIDSHQFIHKRADGNLTNYQAISSIDVSGNQITGTLPALIFALPRLQTFAAVSNCISGSLPGNICNASQVNVLALDGLATSPACQHKIFPHSKRYKAYTLPYRLVGGVPSCLFNMSNLQTLHLSGNGMSGTLPSDIVIGPMLSDLSMSHNGIGGTLPAVFQRRPWASLGLSYNKFSGVLDTAFAHCGPNSKIQLEVNRFSGAVPGNITDAVVVDILQGNLFTCPMTKRTLPSNDENYDHYTCGSNAFYFSVYVWLAVFLFFVTLIVLAVVGYRQNSRYWSQFAVVQYASHFLSQCIAWMSVFSVQPLENFGNTVQSNVFAFGLFCSDMRWKTLMTSFVLLCIVMPIYMAAGKAHQTYTHMYAWAASAMFLSGVIPAVSLFVLLTVVLVLLFHIGNAVVQAKYTRKNTTDTIAETGRHHSYRQAFRQKIAYVLGLAPAMTVNCVTMIGVNVGYVAVTLTSDAYVVLMAQFFLAVFKLFWNEFAVRWMLSLSVRYLDRNAPEGKSEGTGRKSASPVAATSATAATVGDVSSTTADSDVSIAAIMHDTTNFLRVIKEDIPFRTIVLLFNNILTPFIATAIISPVCFNALIYAPPKVNTSYELCLAAVESSNRRCQVSSQNAFAASSSSSETSFSTSFEPPFTYSYQCSSNFVASYASMYVFMFLIVAFVNPVMYLVARRVREETANSQSFLGKQVYFWCDYFLPTFLKPLPRRLKDLTDKRKRDHSTKSGDIKNKTTISRGTGRSRNNIVSVDGNEYQLEDLRYTAHTSTGGSVGRPNSVRIDLEAAKTMHTNNAHSDSDHNSSDISPFSSSDNSPINSRNSSRSNSPLCTTKPADAQRLALVLIDRDTAIDRPSSSLRVLNQNSTNGIDNGSELATTATSLTMRPLPTTPGGSDNRVHRSDTLQSSSPSSSSAAHQSVSFDRSLFSAPSIVSSDRSTLGRVISGRLKSFLNKSATNRGSNNNKQLQRGRKKAIFFSKGRFILRIITEIAILITFGVVFPPLAVLICVSMVSFTLFTQLMMGRFLTLAQSHRDCAEIKRVLESECNGVSTQLIESFPYLVCFAAFFYALFLFDTLGDVRGAIGATGIAVFMVLMPGLLYVLWKAVRVMAAKYTSKKKSETTKSTQKRGHSDGGVSNSSSPSCCDEQQHKGQDDSATAEFTAALQELSHDFSSRHISHGGKNIAEGSGGPAVRNPMQVTREEDHVV